MIVAVLTTPQPAVIIPTHNRSELLAKVLDSILAQTVKTEIYVMDDASTDGTQAMIRSKYPDVLFYREEQNRGPAFQRNKAAAVTQAQIIFTIDDDCIVSSPKTFEQTLEAFDHPRVGAVTIPFVNVLQDAGVHTVAPPGGAAMATHDYFAGMVAFRRQIYQSVGGYRSHLFMHVEEPDLAIRILNAGYIVRLGWADPLDHMESPVRDRPRLDVLGARNHVLYCHYNVPWPYFPVHLAGTTLLCFRHGLNRGRPLRVLRGLAQGYAGILHQWAERKPVSRSVYKLARLLKGRGSMPMQEIEPLLPPMLPSR